MLLAGCGGSSAGTVWSDEPPAAWVQRLGDASYAVRARALNELKSAGPAAHEALRDGCAAADLEIRLRCQELLHTLHRDRFSTELQRLENAVEAGQHYRLPMWESYRTMVGEDAASRRMFVALARRYRSSLQDLATTEAVAWPPLGPLPADAGRDPLRWALLLLVRHGQTTNRCLRDHQIRDQLLRDELSGALQSGKHGDVLRRMVAHLLDDLPASRDRHWMRVALQWQCERQAVRMAWQTLDGETEASPAATALALTTLAKHAPRQAPPALSRFLDDHRTCQIWHLVAATRRRLRTEVRDVALAMLLHLEHQDLRQIGFVDVQADPLTIYRQHTLGFPDEEARRRTWQTASRSGLISLRSLHP